MPAKRNKMVKKIDVTVSGIVTEVIPRKHPLKLSTIGATGLA
jgi:hypothetical protein